MNTYKLNSTQVELLGNYHRYNSNLKGDILEQIARDFMTEAKYPIMEIKHKDMQYYWGDFIVMSRKHDLVKVDIKASHTWNNIDKLAFDYEHYIKNSKLKYIPSNAKDNKGYIHHLKADTIIAINPRSWKLYIINDFQDMQEEILRLMEDYKEDHKSLSYLYDIEISTNRNDRIKDTTIINVPIHSMKTLGAEVKEYELLKGEEIQNVI